MDGSHSVQGLTTTITHAVQSAPVSSAPSALGGLVARSEAVHAFAGYLAENVRQSSRVSLLRSCLLGQKEKMSAALQDHQVNDELPMPFYQWEYVIVFENPDFQGKKKKGVTKEMAEEQFNACFQGESGDSKRQQDINLHFERKAFLEAFAQLPDSDYLPPKWQYLQFSSETKRKAYNQGGMLKKGELHWETQTTMPRDYQTLIRNLIQTKLALHAGLKTRLMLSSTGQYIYLMLAADELDLQNEAERVNYPLQLELGATDLDSLEPCDTSLRPLGRLKKDGFEALLRELESLKAELYREVKSVAEQEDTEREEYAELKLEAEGVGPAEWQSYAEFLEYVAAELRKLRDLHLKAYVNFKRHREIIQAAYLQVNTAHPQARLYSLWDRINVPQAIAAYSPYKRDIDFDSFLDTLHRIA